MQIGRDEVFLNDLAIKDALDVVGPFSSFAPRHVPFTEPEIKLIFRVAVHHASTGLNPL